jgi:SpoVK/Ycf46/Vps4 family AAA+-type ATPase
MITVPLSAGELNRPLVGDTEKLLVDIMYRAHTIPFLICAMTIDEIDGLVPKRDNNAQQSKVDGISVLLSHIEGVKNIPNLIVFGATNRRNMMDEAFLRRMQAKVFVGRPSPATRKNMLNPLICKSKNFTSKRIDALVKVTTNFSGAAVGALRSSIVVEMDRNPNINDRRLLELADTVARENNVWFGISTLPAICRLNPKIFDSKNEEEQFSLNFRDVPPS